MQGGVTMEKKPFYKKKSVWIIIGIIIVIACTTSNDSTTTTNTEIAENEITSTPQVTKEVAEAKETKSEKNTTKNEKEKKQKEHTTEPKTTPVDIENMSNEEQEKFLSDLTDELEESSLEYESELEAEFANETKVYALYAALAENEVYPYTISEKASEFLMWCPDLFSTTKFKKIKDYINYDISYKHIAKNASKYGDSLMCISPAYVISCSETEIDEDTTLTELQLQDNDGNDYMVIYIGTVDVFENDIVECYGLPLGTSSFENISGGTTLAIIVAGSYINKIDY